MPPRDAAERVTFATWAIVTGKSPGGIFNTLPKLDDDTAAKMAQRLSERAEGPITAEDVLTSENIEALADKVRGYLEAGQIDGFVRTLRARPEGSSKVPVFVFHPAGGSTVVYEPLLNRLPADTPMYGFERVEGSIEERAAAIRAEADRDAGRRAVHPGRLVAGRGAGVCVRDRAEAAG